MRLFISFFRQYPSQCTIVFLALIFAGLGEGIGLSTLLPMLSLATGTGAGGSIGDSGAGQVLTSVLAAVHLQPTLATMLVLILISLFMKAALTLLAYRQVGYTVANIGTDLRLSLLRNLSMSRWEYFLKQRSGGLANAIATEATRSAEAFKSTAAVVALLSQSLILVGVALLVNWKAAVLALGVGVLIFFALRGMVLMARRAGAKQQNLFNSLLSLLTDSLQSLKPLKSMAREGEVDRLLERDTRKLNKAMRKEVLSKEGLKAMQELLIGTILVLGVYWALVHWDMALPGVMVLAVVLARTLTKVSKVQQEYQKLVVTESFYWSLQDYISEANAAREQPFGSTAPTLKSGIQLRGVTFHYEDKAVLNGLDLDIPTGQVTALIGPSGAGKTTMVDLVIGLLRASGGDILIDGESISSVDIRQWRSLIGYVPQETVLLHDTIFTNVAIGNSDISEADVQWALEKAGAWDFVRELPEGVQTVVGESGSRFSGGQRQRIVIARALAHRPRLLILDEATSALDPETEKAVSETLRGLGEDYTILTISHRPTLMQLADNVYRIEGGRARKIEDRAELAAESS